MEALILPKVIYAIHITLPTHMSKSMERTGNRDVHLGAGMVKRVRTWETA